MGTINLVKKTVDHKYFDISLRSNHSNYIGYNMESDSLVLEFTDQPDAAQSTSISSEYSSMTGSEDHEDFFIKLYDHIDYNGFDHFRSPKEINYKTGLKDRLHPSRTYNKGELQLVEYFSDVAKTDKVLSISIVYVRNNLGFATSRTTTRTWIRRDGTSAPDSKVTVKDYTLNIEDQIKEVKRRRQNLIDTLTIKVLGLMIQTISETDAVVLDMGRSFMTSHEIDFVNFVDHGDTGIISIVQNATDTWLDNDIGGGATIRSFMVSEMTI